MEFKGTKGKWHLMKKGFAKNGNDNLIQVYATNEDLEFVCQVWKDGILHNKTQNFEANALLISKAPEMLEEHVKDLELLENVAKQFDLDGWLLLDVLQRIQEKQYLIKEATEL